MAWPAPGSSDASGGDLPSPASRTSIFEHVLCGVDLTEESVEAARQAGRLVTGPGKLLFLAALDPWDVHAAKQRGKTWPETRADLTGRLSKALQECEDAAGVSNVETAIVDGAPAMVILDEARRRRSSLLAVGVHTRSRARGIIAGSVASTLLRRASLSVLIARPPSDPLAYPQSIVVGIDGSERSRDALVVARALGERFDGKLEVIAAGSRKRIDEDAVREMAPDVQLDTDSPVKALVGRSTNVDLVVIGSAGLHGVRALGSVSERVAHRADCSVLVVRGTRSDIARGEPRVRVRDIMSTPPIVASEDTTLEAIGRLMIEHQIGCVPIVDDHGSLVGIITNSDFVGKEEILSASRSGHILKVPKLFNEWLTEGSLEEVFESARSVQARDVMSAPVTTANKDEYAEEIARRLVFEGLTHLPVVDQRDTSHIPIGIVTRHDLVRLMSAGRAQPSCA